VKKGGGTGNDPANIYVGRGEVRKWANVT